MRQATQVFVDVLMLRISRLYTRIANDTVTTRMIPAVKMGSDESHFNVSVGSDGQSHNLTTTFLKRKESRSGGITSRTEVLPLTSLASS